MESKAVARWVLVLMLLPVGSLWAQGRTQTIALSPGWNAVYLEVQPGLDAPADLFRGLPVESVWMWNKRFATTQFIQDMNRIVRAGPDWLIYFPTGSPQAFLTNLHVITGGQAYLIHLGGTQTVQWRVRGKAVVSYPDLQTDSFNLVGFNVLDTDPPTFQKYLQPSAALNNNEIYHLAPSGLWTRVADPATAKIAPGRAYWVYCNGPSDYKGPLSVDLEIGSEIDFGADGLEHTVTLQNATPTTKMVTLDPKAAQGVEEGVPDPDPVILTYFSMDLSQGQYGWLPLNGPTAFSVPPAVGGKAGERTIRLAVQRAAMTTAAPLSGLGAQSTALNFASLISVDDGEGVAVQIPVRSLGLVRPVISVEGVLTIPNHLRTGLWVGSVSVDRVNQPSSLSDATTPRPVAQPFDFRVLIHVDENGVARLLQQVLMMFKPGTLVPSADDPSRQELDTPGRYVLVTNDALIPQFSGATERDGDPVGRRLSTVAFSLPEPLAMQGDFGSSVSCAIHIDYRDALNPFVHRYHPDHDNLDARFEAELPEGRESFNFSRSLSFEFTAEDPEGLSMPGWGDVRLGGIYRETLRGTHQHPIRMQGVFQLRQVARAPHLNQ